GPRTGFERSLARTWISSIARRMEGEIGPFGPAECSRFTVTTHHGNVLLAVVESFPEFPRQLPRTRENHHFSGSLILWEAIGMDFSDFSLESSLCSSGRRSMPLLCWTAEWQAS